MRGGGLSSVDDRAPGLAGCGVEDPEWGLREPSAHRTERTAQSPALAGCPGTPGRRCHAMTYEALTPVVSQGVRDLVSGAWSRASTGRISSFPEADLPLQRRREPHIPAQCELHRSPSVPVLGTSAQVRSEEDADTSSWGLREVLASGRGAGPGAGEGFYFGRGATARTEGPSTPNCRDAIEPSPAPGFGP